ncbi:MAG: hypothetical protein RI885_891 [Actinomycetota bacterium]
MASADPPVPHRVRRLAFVVVVLLLVVAGLVVAAEFLARGIVADTVRDQVRAGLAVDSSTPIDVEVAGRSVLLQVLSGRLERVTAEASEVTFGDLSGDVRLRASGVPIDGEGTADEVDLAVTIPESDLLGLSKNLSGLPITEVTVERPDVRFSVEFDVLAFTLPLSVTVTPEAVDGALAFTPSSVTLGEQTFTAAELRTTFGSLAESALDTQDLCIAEFLPEALALESLEVGSADLTLRFGGSDVALSERALSTVGSCGG